MNKRSTFFSTIMKIYRVIFQFFEFCCNRFDCSKIKRLTKRLKVLTFYNQYFEFDTNVAFVIKIVVNVIEKFHDLLLILEMIYMKVSYDLNMFIDFLNRLIDNDNNFNLKNFKIILVDYHFVTHFDFLNALCEIHVIDKRR